MEINFCKYHPEKIAHFKCYECRAPICADCRKNFRHHYFCSRSCYLTYQKKEILKFLKDKQGLFLLAGQLLLLLMMVVLFTVFRAQLKEAHPVQKPPSPQMAIDTNLAVISDFLQANYQVKEPTDFTRTSEPVYRFKLPVKPHWIVNIWKNGRPIVTQTTRKEEMLIFRLPLDYGENRFRVLVLNNRQQPVYRDEFYLLHRRASVEAFRQSIDQGNPRVAKIAFTFDGGSDDAHTREILQILRDNQVQATLFLTGKFMQRHPDLVRQMLADGHEIGNHTFSHPHLTSFAKNRRQDTLPGITRAFFQHQLTKTDSLFYQITGQHLKPFWRAPYGEFNNQILTWAAQAGYLHIHWTRGFDTYDWVTDQSSRLFRTPEQLVKQIKAKESRRANGLNGVIVLMHLGSHRNNNHAFKMLPEIFRWLRQKGYTITTISDLLTPSQQDKISRK